MLKFVFEMRRGLQDYFPADIEAIEGERMLPSGCCEDPDDISLEKLIYHTDCFSSRKARDNDLTGYEEHVVHVEIDKSMAGELARFPNLQRVTYQDPKTTVLPKEVLAVERLRMLGLRDMRKFRKLPKNLSKADKLEALTTATIHNLADASAIEGLPSLRFLCLYNTIKLEDYGFLETLPALRHLQLESVEPDAFLPAVKQLQQLEALEVPSCFYFERTVTQLAELIEALPNLRRLGLQSVELYGNQLPPLEHIEELDLRSGESLHSSFFHSLPNLRALSWEHCDEEALPERFAALANLEMLNLSFSGEKMTTDDDFAPLEGLTKLERLHFSHGHVPKLPASMAAMTSLRQLEAEGYRLKDISAIKGLPALESVNVGCGAAPAQVLDVLMSLPKLRRAAVPEGTDIKALAAHPTLERVYCRNIEQADAGPDFHVYQSMAYRKR